MIEPHKDLLQIEDLSKEEIESILAAAQPFKELFKRSVKKVPTLQNKFPKCSKKFPLKI